VTYRQPEPIDPDQECCRGILAPREKTLQEISMEAHARLTNIMRPPAERKRRWHAVNRPIVDFTGGGE
jgi:hypothetical protein